MKPAITPLAVLLTLGATALAAPQRKPSQAGGLVAEFTIGDKKRSLSRDEVASFLGRRHRNSSTGRKTIDHLIEVALVRRAAKQKGLMPTRDEVRTQTRTIAKTYGMSQRKKISIEQLAGMLRMTVEQFEDMTAMGMAQQRLAAKVLDTSPDKVSANDLALWTKEQRNKTKVVVDPKQLPSGVLAKVGDFAEVTELDVGRVLFTKLTPAALTDSINHLVYQQCIAHEAKQHGVEIEKADLEREYTKKKRAFEANARNNGLKYENWLEAFGSDKQKEMASPTMRTNILHGKLVRHLHPAADLDKRLKDDREALLRRHGARRSLSVLFIRATKNPNKIVRRDFAAAKKHITDLRKTITEKKRSFALMTKIASDDPKTKNSGGKIGWQHNEYRPYSRGRRVPQEVLDAAFKLKIGGISQPVETKQGYYLVWANGLEPDPNQVTLRNRLLGELGDRYNRRLYDAAKIEVLIK